MATLEALGVKRVYGLIGTSVLELFDALYERRNAIRLITTRHEQVAASMADAEGRLTGFPGTAIVHAGPGFLNTLISVANAYKDSSPLVLIAGGVRRRLRGLDSWLEVDQASIMAPLAKSVHTITNAQEAGRILEGAYEQAMAPPRGPVFVEVPEDVQRESYVGALGASAISAPAAPVASPQDVERAARQLQAATRPLIIAGGGINCEEGARLLELFVERHLIPVASTGNGRGALREDHELCLGRVGFGGGNPVADYALARADVLLALGAGISDVTTYAHTNMPRGRIISVNLDPRCEQKPPPCDLHLFADAPSFLRALYELMGSSSYRAPAEWLSELSERRELWGAMLEQALAKRSGAYVNANKFFAALDERSPSDVIVSAGQGLHILYSYAYQRIRGPRSFLAATNMGSMGFALPAALAAKLVYPAREVLAVVGDGELMMTLQDLETAVREKLGIRLIVVNDNAYGVLYARQRVQKGGRIHGTRYGNPDFVQLAQAFGLKGIRVSADDQIAAAIDEMFAHEGPVLVELVVDPDELPPTNLQANLAMGMA